MNCLFDSFVRSTCWRGYNYCKFLKMCNQKDTRKPFVIRVIETEFHKKVPIKADGECSHYTKSRITALRRVKKLREKIDAIEILILTKAHKSSIQNFLSKYMS